MQPYSCDVRIAVRNIIKRFGEKTVIDNLSMEIASESFTTLLGPSGCGKTTLLRMIAGLETPDSGEIFLGDRCVYSSEKGIALPPEERGIGFVFQDFALWPHMRVRDNVAFGLRAQKKTDGLEEKVREALHAVQLDDYAERYPSELSGGQQQRVSFARAIVTEPECILFDEPLSALDALLREEMRSELKALVASRGITAVFVTHDQTEAMSMSDRIAVLSGGRIEQYDTPENLYAHPATAFSAHFIGSSNWIDDRTMFRPENASIGGNGECFNADVRGAEFMGSYYRLLLSYNGRKWTIDAKERHSVGETLRICVGRNAIITI